METIREVEDQKSKEKAQAYGIMCDMWAFKDFMESILRIREMAIKDLYQVSDFQVTEAKFGEIRGILKAIAKIELELDQILSWRNK